MRENAFGGLWQSWMLVDHAGFWRVFGTLLLGYLCLLPLGIVGAAGELISGRVGGVVTVVLSVITTPLVAVFTTLMYVLATGGRERIGWVLAAPTGRCAHD